MTVTDAEVEALPDLDQGLPCQCPGEAHQPEGCDRTARYRATFPCGHCPELLCGTCTSDLIAMIDNGCPEPGCDELICCPQCDQPAEHVVVRPL